MRTGITQLSVNTRLEILKHLDLADRKAYAAFNIQMQEHVRAQEEQAFEEERELFLSFLRQNQHQQVRVSLGPAAWTIFPKMSSWGLSDVMNRRPIYLAAEWPLIEAFFEPIIRVSLVSRYLLRAKAEPLPPHIQLLRLYD